MRLREIKDGLVKKAVEGTNFAVDNALEVPVARWIVRGALPQKFIIERVERKYGMNKWRACLSNLAFNLAFTTTWLATSYRRPDLKKDYSALGLGWLIVGFLWSFKSYPANAYRIGRMIKTKEVMGDYWVELGYKHKHHLGKGINYLLGRLDNYYSRKTRGIHEQGNSEEER